MIKGSVVIPRGCGSAKLAECQDANRTGRLGLVCFRDCTHDGSRVRSKSEEIGESISNP
jgi:hypothetical protein